MATVQRIPLGRKPGQARIDLPERVSVSLTELGSTVKEGLLAFAVAVGLQVFSTLMEEDLAQAVGPKGRHDPDRAAYRHSREEAAVPLGGRKVKVTKPRARSVDGQEVRLPTWEAFAGEEMLREAAVARMLAGLSTRRYGAGLEPVGGDVKAFGTSRSAVSRRFTARTTEALRELMGRDLSGVRICAVFADGIEIAEHTMVVALGVDDQGRKHPLGVREGTTENAPVCRALLSDVVERGLEFSGGILLVIDGGKGLRKAVREVFGSLGLVARCRLHKRRNVMDHLPPEQHAFVGRQLDKAWRMDDVLRAERALRSLADRLEAHHPGAAGSLREGLEETLTVSRLKLPPTLERTLYTTNPVESMISIARDVMRNVKRWRDGKMIERWTAAGVLVAERQFRRVKGYRDIPILLAALGAHAEKVSGIVSEAGDRVA
jgi:putative transposase